MGVRLRGSGVEVSHMARSNDAPSTDTRAGRGKRGTAAARSTPACGIVPPVARADRSARRSASGRSSGRHRSCSARRAGPAPRADARIVLRGLGSVLAIAFASLHVQLLGLVGARGIAPPRSSWRRRATSSASRPPSGSSRPGSGWRAPTPRCTRSAPAGSPARSSCGRRAPDRAPRGLVGDLSLAAVGRRLSSRTSGTRCSSEERAPRRVPRGPEPSVGIYCLRSCSSS